MEPESPQRGREEESFQLFLIRLLISVYAKNKFFWEEVIHFCFMYFQFIFQPNNQQQSRKVERLVILKWKLKFCVVCCLKIIYYVYTILMF